MWPSGGRWCRDERGRAVLRPQYCVASAAVRSGACVAALRAYATAPKISGLEKRRVGRGSSSYRAWPVLRVDAGSARFFDGERTHGALSAPQNRMATGVRLPGKENENGRWRRRERVPPLCCRDKRPTTVGLGGGDGNEDARGFCPR